MERRNRRLYRLLLPNGKLLFRLENGGVQNVSRHQALLNYLLRRNRNTMESPSFELKNDSETDYEHNFDVKPNTVGFARQHSATSGLPRIVLYYGVSNWRYSKNLGVRVLSFLDFWPFNHLGDISIVLARKPD